jgi:hydroxymethylbilane synthase
MKEIIIGTRASELALAQAQEVQEKLQDNWPKYDFKLEKISTKGDRILDRELVEIEGKGIFIKEIEVALLNEEIDLAVHSCKDLPSDLPRGLAVLAIPRRANPLDVLVTKEDLSLDELPAGAKLGTGSLRRKAQLLNYRPELKIEPIRGNVNTRLEKLAQDDIAGLVLAAAGLERLGREDVITQYLSPDICLPAPRQGALALEGRTGDAKLKKLVAPLKNPKAEVVITAEHAFLAYLNGGCKVPVGAYAQLKGNKLEVEGIVASLEGQEVLRDKIVGPREEADKLGRKLAQSLVDQGAAEILEEVRQVIDN